MKMFLYMKVKKMLIEVQNEVKLMKELLEHLGFCITKFATQTILDIDNLTKYFSPDTYIIRKDTYNVGNCSVDVLSDGSMAVTTIVVPSYIPEEPYHLSEEIINQLLLLGFTYKTNDWLEYRVIIKDITDDNSAEDTG